MSTPLMRTRPFSGLSSPMSDFRKTVLPVPDGPSITLTSPAGRVSDTSRQMLCLPKDLVRPSTTTSIPISPPADANRIRAAGPHVKSARSALTTGAARIFGTPAELVTALTTSPPRTCLQGDRAGSRGSGGVDPAGPRRRTPGPDGGWAGTRPPWLRPTGATDLEPSTAPARYGRVTSAGNTGSGVFRDTDFGHPEPVTEGTRTRRPLVIE